MAISFLGAAVSIAQEPAGQPDKTSVLIQGIDRVSISPKIRGFNALTSSGLFYMFQLARLSKLAHIIKVRTGSETAGGYSDAGKPVRVAWVLRQRPMSPSHAATQILLLT